MDVVRSLDHTSIALDHIPVALPLFRDVLGGRLVGGDVEGAFRWVQLVFPGGGKIELLDPTTPDSFVRRFLDARGPGVHHVTFKVHDLHQAVAAAERGGYEVFGQRDDDPEWKEAFIHPRHAHGVLVQLAQSAHDEGDPDSPYTLEKARQIVEG